MKNTSNRKSWLNPILAATLFLFCLLAFGCGHTDKSDDNLTFTIGFDEDYKLKTYYDGGGWNNMSRWMTSLSTNEDGPFEISFLADKNYSQMTTNHSDIWIRGTLQPLNSSWHQFAWNMKVSSKKPIELIFFGFQNTSHLQTNEDGTVFNFPGGETNISFEGGLVSVFEKEKSTLRKK